MKRRDRIKLDFIRKWKMPGKKRLSKWLKKFNGITLTLKDVIVWLNEEDNTIYYTADNLICNMEMINDGSLFRLPL